MSSRKRKPEIIVVSVVEDFRELVNQKVAADDCVLEIGCSAGKTTARLAKACARVVAVDISDEMIDQTRAEAVGCDNVEVVKGDARDITALESLLPDPDVIFLDIGGTALLDNVASLLRQCLRAFRPRLIVVRSHELAEVADLITDARPPARPHLLKPEPAAREGAVHALIDLSRSSTVSGRLLAVRKLRSLASPEARERLAEMTSDPNVRVARAARNALSYGLYAK